MARQQLRGSLSGQIYWTDDQLQNDIQVSIEIFRRVRMEEPLEAYLDLFEEERDAVETLLELTVDLTRLYEEAQQVVGDPRLRTVLRYLPGPPISEDDLKVITLSKSFTPSRLASDASIASQVVDSILQGLDRRRFPWYHEHRSPNEAEKHAAIIATSAMLAYSRLFTSRRINSKSEQEEKVAETLIKAGFSRVRRRDIVTLDDAPNVGEFCPESMLGSRKADLIVRLWDRRLLAIECKVSNSTLNSVKRISNDAAVKAEVWNTEFGNRQIVPAAVLSGVFGFDMLSQAQKRGLMLFWAHDIEALTEWIEGTRPD